MEEKNVETPAQDADVQEKGRALPPAVRKLLIALMAVLFLAALFLALRAGAIYSMDHFASIAVNQAGVHAPGSTLTALLDNSARQVAVANQTSVQGAEQQVVLTSFYRTESGNHMVEAYHIRFDSEASAQAYLDAQGSGAGRQRYRLGRYYFDYPVLQADDAENSAYNEAARELRSLDMITLLYRLCVAFDFTSGMEAAS